MPRFENVLAVAAIAFAAPLLLSLAPAVRVPSVVVELLAGIVVGPALGWVEIDEPVRILSLVGLAFLLLVAGLEVDLERLRGAVLRLAAGAFAISLALAGLTGGALQAAGLVGSGGLVGVMLAATSLGVVVPVLKDSGRIDSGFGQLTLAGASIADVVTVLLLSVLFSGQSGSTAARLVLLGGFTVAVASIAAAVLAAERWRGLSRTLERLQDTTAQIRVRGAFLLLAAFAALAGRLGVETILGAFMAGVVLNVADRDRMMTHPAFRLKLEGAAFGIFVPAFFVSSGLAFDLDALAEPATLAHVPLFLAALLVVRGLPALAYRRAIGTRAAIAAGLLQATSLSFLVVAGQIGVAVGLLSAGSAAALVAAGLLSVVAFPAAALAVLGGRPERRTAAEAVAPV